MKNTRRLGTHFQRWKDKQSIKTFTFDKTNDLDYPIDKTISEIERKYSDCERLMTEIKNLLDSKPNEIDLDEFELLTLESDSYLFQTWQYNDELLALHEMKIIHAYRFFEINLKRLLSSAFSDAVLSKRIYWEALISFMSEKKIPFKQLNSYEKVNQLRIVNNAIKHSKDDYFMDQELKKIPEFRDNTGGKDYTILGQFYSRVKEAPISLLDDLSKKVYLFLYEFSDKRIEQFARTIALRMEEEDAEKLITEIRAIYTKEKYSDHPF